MSDDRPTTASAPAGARVCRFGHKHATPEGAQGCCINSRVWTNVHTCHVMNPPHPYPCLACEQERSERLVGEALDRAAGHLPMALSVREKTPADALKAYAEWCGGVHDEGCPEDDTCDCSGKWINDGITE